MQHTSKYQFNLVDATDDFSPAPLNQNAQKTEAALVAMEESLTGQIEEMEGSLASLAANVGTAGKTARIAWGSYTGTGTYGASNPTSLSVGFYPVLVLVGSVGYIGYRNWPMTLFRPSPKGSPETASSEALFVTWTDASVSWYDEYGEVEQANTNGEIYYYCVIGYDKAAE